MKTAFRYWDDGKQWLRIITESAEWDEPITGWSEILNMTNGEMSYRHKDGREIRAH